MRTLITSLLVTALAIGFVHSASAQTTSLSDIRNLASQSRYEDAYRQLQAYLERQPADEQARLLEGVLLTRLNRVDDAIDAFRRLTEDNPNLAEPHNNLAVLYAAKGRFEAARESLLQAIALNPDYRIARENLGDVYARLADIEYRHALRLDQTNARIHNKAETVATLFEPIAANEATGTTSIPAETPPVPEVPAPSAIVSAEPAKRSCVMVDGIEDRDAVDTVVSWLEGHGARNIETGNREAQEITSYQIYVPPLPGRGEAKATAARMKESGIDDLYVIGSGELKNGISLGIYVTESASGRHMAKIRDMGYDARRRPRFDTRAVFHVEADLSAATIDAADISRKFSDLSTEAIPCR